MATLTATAACANCFRGIRYEPTQRQWVHDLDDGPACFADGDPNHEVATPEDTCGRPMRDGPCALDRNHRGRCTTIAFDCDGCGVRRRSQPTSVARNPWDGEVEAQFCFMCTKVYWDPATAVNR